MSYEGTHWLCSHSRKECDGNCNPQPVEDCPTCGRDPMVCPCESEDHDFSIKSTTYKRK